MVRSLGLLAVLAAAVSSRAPAQDLVGPKLTPLSFGVGKASEEAERPAGARDRTNVTARLELPGRKIVAVDPAKCKVDGFTDDRGTDLLAAAGPDHHTVQVSQPLLKQPLNNLTFSAPACPARPC
jgi:hypothetical protein